MLSSEWESCPNCPPPCGAVPIPLKRLADTYHVSILAVHHLRKTSSSDVLDEITGSIGMTGAVDGTLILKREREQQEGMSPREIAEALKKNYHTTRSILRKMEGMGEIVHL
jgi:hypothetical protein